MAKRKPREDRSRLGSEDAPFNPAFAAFSELRARPKVPAPEPSEGDDETGGDDEGPSPGAGSAVAAAPEEPAPRLSAAGKVVVRREKKGRGGKTVTRIDGLDPGLEGLDAVAKALARSLGCGAKVEDSSILLQGAQSERAASWLEGRGIRRVVIGDHPPRPGPGR